MKLKDVLNEVFGSPDYAARMGRERSGEVEWRRAAMAHAPQSDKAGGYNWELSNLSHEDPESPNWTLRTKNGNKIVAGQLRKEQAERMKVSLAAKYGPLIVNYEEI